MRIEELLESVDSDVRRRVADAYRAHGSVSRNIMRDETRLRMQAPEELREQGATDSSVSVSIEVAHPRARWDEIPPEVELAARLARWTPVLHAMMNSGRATDAMLHELAPLLAPLAEVTKLRASPGEAARLAEILLQLAGRFDLVKHILEVDEDILGVYRIRGGTEGQSSSIELYWAVIGLVAEVLGVEAHALSLVVLAHELGHAYTHLGYDIDGERGHKWFEGLDHMLCESLAQYYTDRIARRLDVRVPGTRHAYELLVVKQPLAYRGHLPWIDSTTPEAMRSAILLARRNAVTSYDAFDALLRKTGRRMKPGGVDSN